MLSISELQIQQKKYNPSQYHQLYKELINSDTKEEQLINRCKIDKFLLDRWNHNFKLYGFNSFYYIQNPFDFAGEYKWYFITFNYSMSSKIEDIKIWIEKFIKSKWIKKYVYCYEQRSEKENIFSGIHIHSLIAISKNTKCPSKPSAIRRLAAQMGGKKLKIKNLNLGSLMGNINNKNIFNIKSTYDKELIFRRYRYITGSEKQEKKK